MTHDTTARTGTTVRSDTAPDRAAGRTDRARRDRARVPAGQTLSSLLGLGPMPFTKIVRCHELVGESHRIGRDREAGEWTHAESSLRRAAERRADAWARREIVKTVEPVVATVKGLHAEARLIGHQIEALRDRRYVGPHGESYTSAEAQGRHAEWSGRVRQEEQEGSRAHGRVSARLKRALLALLGLDVVILTFLMAKFLNVDLARFAQTTGGVLKATTALVFGVLGTFGVALVMKMFGRRHRAWRAAHGGWDFSRSGKAGRTALVAELLLCALVVVALGTAMAWRFVLDGASGGEPFLTAVMAGLFALVVGAVAYLSYQSEFADGSAVTEAIDVLAPQLHGASLTEAALRGRHEIVVRQAARLLDQLARDAERIRGGAVRTVAESVQDKAIRYARSIHQCSGYGGTLPAPLLALDSLDLALAQAADPDGATGPVAPAAAAADAGLAVAA